MEIEHEVDSDVAIRSARVLGHGKTRKEPLDQAKPWWGTYSTIGLFYTGKITPPSPRSPRIVMTDEIRDLVRARR